MAEPRFGIGQNDRQKLNSFVNETELFLNEVLNEDRGENVYFISELYRPMMAAWEVMGRHFKDIITNIDKTSDELLIQHGLTGTELQFKLRVINYLWSKFADFREPPPEEGAKVVPKIFWHPKIIAIHPFQYYLRWLLKILLEAIDKLLISILDATGASGAAAEFKSFMESCIDVHGLRDSGA